MQLLRVAVVRLTTGQDTCLPAPGSVHVQGTCAHWPVPLTAEFTYANWPNGQIFKYGEMRKQVELLKHHADFLPQPANFF